MSDATQHPAQNITPAMRTLMTFVTSLLGKSGATIEGMSVLALARKTGLHRETVAKSMRALHDAGLLSWTPGVGRRPSVLAMRGAPGVASALSQSATPADGTKPTYQGTERQSGCTELPILLTDNQFEQLICFAGDRNVTLDVRVRMYGTAVMVMQSWKPADVDAKSGEERNS